MREHHTPEGWDYFKVNAVIANIHDIFNRLKLTFVEEQVVLSWFQCQLQYNLGKIATKDVLDELFPEKEAVVAPVRSEIYS